MTKLGGIAPPRFLSPFLLAKRANLRCDTSAQKGYVSDTRAILHGKYGKLEKAVTVDIKKTPHKVQGNVDPRFVASLHVPVPKIPELKACCDLRNGKAA